jgi:inositol-pentakisphosphate 2-kinase
VSKDLVLEFKPKWLSQSLSAPDGAVRCRNCANEEQKYDRRGSDTTGKGIALCPLDLLHCGSEPRTLELVTRSLPIKPGISDARRERLHRWLQGTHLFHHLRNKQLEKDRVGPLPATGEGLRDQDRDDLALAMTLRDCSCYVCVPADENKPVRAKLADLDRKNAKAGKLDYWRRTEQSLLDYYSAKLKPARVTNCRLERERSGTT